jgi:hypothetical protein
MPKTHKFVWEFRVRRPGKNLTAGAEYFYCGYEHEARQHAHRILEREMGQSRDLCQGVVFNPHGDRHHTQEVYNPNQA